MSSAQMIMKGIMVFFISILFGVICNYGALMPLTMVTDGFTSSGVYDVSAEWDTRDDVDRLVLYTHICVYLMPILGLLYFAATIIKVLYYTEQQDEYSAGQVYQERF